MIFILFLGGIYFAVLSSECDVGQGLCGIDTTGEFLTLGSDPDPSGIRGGGGGLCVISVPPNNMLALRGFRPKYGN